MGLDPEVAIVSKKTGKGRSAHMFIGDVINQFSFENEYDSLLGSEIGRDGAVLEVRSLVDSACRDNIIPYVAEALRKTALDLEKWRKGHFKLSSAAKIELDSQSLADPPPDVVEFGCAPDMDAYALGVKQPSCAVGDKRRWTGGHIHVSRAAAKGNVEQQAALAILFDYAVALPMVAILGDKFAEGEAERRELYGQPGSFRYDDELDKIEFRTLSGRVLLSPVLLAWAMGMIKSVMSNMQSDDYKGFLQKNLLGVLDPSTVYDVVIKHDVAGARELAPKIFTLLPGYQENESDLFNKMSDGGGGTINPYFYGKAFDVLSAGEQEGLSWDDDLTHNWGFYEDYEPVHHSYWGVQVAMAGLCDSDIFPMRDLLPKFFPANAINEKPLYTHPLNGGAKQWVTPGAASWLQ